MKFSFEKTHVIRREKKKLNNTIIINKNKSLTVKKHNQLVLRMFVLAFVVKVEVVYNLIIHKTQLQKLIFFYFLVGPTSKTQHSSLKKNTHICT